MEQKALASLILRIAGMLIVVAAVMSAARSLGALVNPEAVQSAGLGTLLVVAFFSVVVPLLIGSVLIYFPATVSGVLKIGGETPRDSDIAPLQRVAFATIGLWLCVQAVLETVFVYAKVRLYRRFAEDAISSGAAPSLLPDDFAAVVSAGLQLLIGLWLLLGSRGLAAFLHRLRN